MRNAGFNTPEDVLNSTVEELTKAEGIGEKTAEKIFESAKNLLNKNPEPEIVEEKKEEKVIEKAEEAIKEELIAEEKEANVAEGVEQSEMAEAGYETEPSAEKEVNEELEPKDRE